MLERYWCSERGLLADSGERADFSEHAQALGILAGLTPPGGASNWTDAWLSAATDLAAPSLYFTHYVLDALHRAGRDETLHARLRAWREVSVTGLLTVPEAPEPTRSDCHVWSAHARWHFAASVAGVRSAAPGFARVEVAPQFGALRHIDAEVFHPRGRIRVTLTRTAGRVEGTVALPPEAIGRFRWAGRSIDLAPGNNAINQPESADTGHTTFP